MQKISYEAVQNRPFLIRALIYGLIAFEVCFLFPFRLSGHAFGIGMLFLLLPILRWIGEAFVCLYGQGKFAGVYLRVMGFTVLGLVCRYLLEYGEVSNTYNFTLPNTAACVILFPLVPTVAYLIFAWLYRRDCIQ